MRPKTLLEMSGAAASPATLGTATIVVIDAQREYVDGKLKLPEAGPALAEIRGLLDRARKAQAPIVHVQHRGRPGGAFGPDTAGFIIADEAMPQAGEAVVEKNLPNAFAGTNLKAKLDALGRKEIILAGFMTHMCVEATVRAAIDHGLKATVVAAATATRDLPDPLTDAAVPAAEVHRNALTAMADRFATIVPDANAIPD
jgi:nicotinamidase-related amidase